MKQDTKTPLGVLVIGRKRPGFDQEWNGVMRAAAERAVDALGYAPVGHDTPAADDAQIAAVLDRVRAAKCDALLILQPSIGNGQLAVTVSQQWPGPVVLWATPERQESDKVSSCSLVGQHMLASILRAVGHGFELVDGHPDEVETRQRVAAAITVCRAVASVRRSKVGLIGAQPPGYVAMAADPLVTRQQLGAQVSPLSLPQFIDRVLNFDAGEVARDVDAARALKLSMADDVTAADLELQSRYYLAMRAVAAEESLDGLAVKEWPELSNGPGWPYLAFARLAGEGVPVGMEGDADGTLTCLIGKHLGAGDGFITDWLEHDDAVVHYWHPGTAPLSLLDAPRLVRHFNITKPTAVDGPLRVGRPVTVARLWRRDGRYTLTAFEGETVAPRRVTSGNAAWVAVDGGGVRAWFDELCHAGLPHHPVIFEGRHADGFRRLARAMKLDWLGK